MSSSAIPPVHKKDPERMRFTMCGLRSKHVKCVGANQYYNCTFCVEDVKAKLEGVR